MTPEDFIAKRRGVELPEIAVTGRSVEVWHPMSIAVAEKCHE
jgi:hypothetical protein